MEIFESDAVLLEQAACSDQHIVAVDARSNAVAGQVLELLDWELTRQTRSLELFEHGQRQWVAAPRFGGAGQAEDLATLKGAGREHLRNPRLALGERPGLVENDRLDSGR